MLNVLVRVKNMPVKSEEKINHCAEMLENLNTNELDDQVASVTRFVAEQLRLVSTHPNKGRRYS